MNVNITAEDLIRFEEEVCTHFSDKKILAPVHLENGNEDQLIEIFTKIVNEDDWICGSWRMHFKSLLKYVPKRQLMSSILKGKSISLCFPQYKVISSAIVGGILPIAVGIAMGIKRSGGTNKVVCFVGDMTSETGSFHECYKYSTNHNLSITWIIEDNGKSVCTPTLSVWNMRSLTYGPEFFNPDSKKVYQVAPNMFYYRYSSKYPHAGHGARIQF